MSSLVGCQIEMVEAGSSFAGKVIQENANLGKLVVLLDTGELQNFFRRDLTSITVLKIKTRPESKMSGCGGQPLAQLGRKMQDYLPRSRVDEDRTVDNAKHMPSEPGRRGNYVDERCVRSEEEMKEIFSSVRPERAVLPSRIERPETLGKVCTPFFIWFFQKKRLMISS